MDILTSGAMLESASSLDKKWLVTNDRGLQLEFRLLPRPPSKKVLGSFARDAGWPRLQRGPSQLQHPNARVQWLGVHHGGTLVGIAQLAFAPPEFCFLSSFVVKRKVRRMGIGTCVVGELERYCADSGIGYLVLEPTAESLPFYLGLSYLPDPLVAGMLRKKLGSFAQKRLSA